MLINKFLIISALSFHGSLLCMRIPAVAEQREEIVRGIQGIAEIRREALRARADGLVVQVFDADDPEGRPIAGLPELNQQQVNRLFEVLHRNAQNAENNAANERYRVQTQRLFGNHGIIGVAVMSAPIIIASLREFREWLRLRQEQEAQQQQPAVQPQRQPAVQPQHQPAPDWCTPGNPLRKERNHLKKKKASRRGLTAPERARLNQLTQIKRATLRR